MSGMDVWFSSSSVIESIINPVEAWTINRQCGVSMGQVQLKLENAFNAVAYRQSAIRFLFYRASVLPRMEASKVVMTKLAQEA